MVNEITSCEIITLTLQHRNFSEVPMATGIAVSTLHESASLSFSTLERHNGVPAVSLFWSYCISLHTDAMTDYH